MQIRAGLNENGAMSKVSYTGKIGSIIYAPTATALPGTLICDGSAVSRSTYADLFAVLGTTAGSGDGSSTFNLPDLRNVWTVGAGTNAALADVAEGLPNVTGEAGLRGGPLANGDVKLVQNRSVNPNNTGALYLFLHTNSFYDVATGALENGSHIDAISLDLSRGNAIYGASAHVTPASVALTPCIVYE